MTDELTSNTQEVRDLYRFLCEEKPVRDSFEIHQFFSYHLFFFFTEEFFSILRKNAEFLPSKVKHVLSLRQSVTMLR